MSGRGRGRGRGRGGGGGGGRGEYYKNKYGGGGRGGRGRDGGGGGGGGRGKEGGGNNGGSYNDLISVLYRIDNKSYPAYHDIESFTRGWISNGFTLYVGRAQSDSYAPPTRCKLLVPASTAQFPSQFYQTKVRSVALADAIHRSFFALCQKLGADQSSSGNGGWSGPKGGDVAISSPNQHVLEQSAVSVCSSTGDVTAQFTVNLPARGRTILGSKAVDIFERIVPILVQQSLLYSSFSQPTVLQNHILCVDDQHWLRNQLSAAGLVAFVPNGAILPRASGADDTPMINTTTVVPFTSPPSQQVTFQLPNSKQSISGMGIRKGVTVIVGGGFHGKSTLLLALQYGVYDKIPGDGREFLVTDFSAVKIRAEDGRAVTAVDITSFISNLPHGKNTQHFTSMDASGSTSQASNIIEALEMKAQTLLVDEDTCATNFMIRDDKMIQLVAPDKEPITPFVKKIRSLYNDKGVSSILVIGGSGDYFDVADVVLMMDCYKCLDVTTRAKEIANQSQTPQQQQQQAALDSIPFGATVDRFPQPSAFQTDGKVAVRAKSTISYGDVDVDLSGLEQIISKSQTNAISLAMQKISSTASPFSNRSESLWKLMETLDAKIDKDGLDTALTSGKFHGGLSRPRMFEIAGAMNRLRRKNTMVQSNK